MEAMDNRSRLVVKFCRGVLRVDVTMNQRLALERERERERERESVCVCVVARSLFRPFQLKRTSDRDRPFGDNRTT